jgi:hypothetical protein
MALFQFGNRDYILKIVSCSRCLRDDISAFKFLGVFIVEFKMEGLM